MKIEELTKYDNPHLDVLRLHTICRAALLHHLQHDLLHLLVWRLELSDQDQHHLPGVVVGVLRVHQRDQITNSFEESCQTLATVSSDTFIKKLIFFY